MKWRVNEKLAQQDATPLSPPGGVRENGHGKGLFRDLGRRFAMTASITLTCILITQCAFAEQADRSKPVNVDADSVQMDNVNKTSFYQGDVVLQQGTLLLRSNTLSMHQDPQGFSTATAIGSPAYFRQLQDGSSEYIEGWADHIDVDNKQNTILLTGNARLKRGTSEMHAEAMMYNTSTQKFWAKPAVNAPRGGANTRVRTSIFPKSAPQTPASPLPLQNSTTLPDGQATHE
jgi:lipopolysaccharide export system protein LptA